MLPPAECPDGMANGKVYVWVNDDDILKQDAVAQLGTDVDETDKGDLCFTIDPH